VAPAFGAQGPRPGALGRLSTLPIPLRLALGKMAEHKLLDEKWALITTTNLFFNTVLVLATIFFAVGSNNIISGRK